MQRIEQPAGTLPATSQRRTLSLAWLTLLGFFLLFVLLVALATLLIVRYYRTVTTPQDATLVVRGLPEWVAWQPVGRTIFQGVADGQAIREGDTIRAAATAGYGQVASLVLPDESQVDLWAGAELAVDALRTTRWNTDTFSVVLRQHTGYARYDIAADQDYQQVSFQVGIGAATVELTPGGSYSIDLRRPVRQITLLDERAPVTADIAVRSGSLVVLGSNGERVILGPRQRVEVDPTGIPGPPVPARWELIADGGFSQYTEQEYNNTTLEESPTILRSSTWQVSGTPTLPDEQRGFFRLSPICRPPALNTLCPPEDRRTAAWFYRAGGQTQGFATFITQQLGPDGAGVDISEYRTLTFSLWAQVLYQSLPDVGDRGTECPVMIRITGRRESPADPDIERVVCVYTDIDDEAPRVKSDEVMYMRIDRLKWEPIRLDLRAEEWMPDFRYLRRVQIYANGHDYDARVADVSLIGEQ
jgi:hypothetical protein